MPAGRDNCAMNRESRANAETQIEIVEADLARADHQQAIVALIDAYAADPLGNGRPLSAEVRETLIPELRQHPSTLILLAYQAGRVPSVSRSASEGFPPSQPGR